MSVPKDTELPGFPGRAPAGSEPLEMYPGLTFAELARAWSRIAGWLPGPFNPSGRPGMSILSQLYCEVVMRLGPNEVSYAVAVAMFSDLLGRLPSVEEAQAAVERLGDGSNQAARLALARGILNTDEARNRILNSLYVTYLGRVADASGIEFWRPYLARGVRLEDVMSGFLASDEFFQKAGRNPSNLVGGYYLTTLVRPAEAYDLRYWVPLLGSVGPTERRDVATKIIDSDEGRLKFLAFSYQAYLGRAIDGVGAPYWLGRMKEGVARLGIIAEILSTNEYRDQAVRRFGSFASPAACE